MISGMQEDTVIYDDAVREQILLRSGVSVTCTILDRFSNEVAVNRLEQELASSLTLLYSAIGWNDSGYRTPERNRRMLSHCGLYVAVHTLEGELIGFGRVPYDEYASVIFDVITHPAHRRQGIASEVLKRILAGLDQHSRHAMLVDGSGIAGFYESHGFVEASDERVMYSG